MFFRHLSQSYLVSLSTDKDYRVYHADSRNEGAACGRVQRGCSGTSQNSNLNYVTRIFQWLYVRAVSSLIIGSSAKLKVWKLSPIDMCEIARNSVLQVTSLC